MPYLPINMTKKKMKEYIQCMLEGYLTIRIKFDIFASLHFNIYVQSNFHRSDDDKEILNSKK